MKKNIELDTGKKIFPIAVMVVGIGLMLALLIGQLNIIAVVSVAFMCITSALIVLGLIFKNKLYAPFVFAYAFAGIGIASYYTIFGADAGFGAFTSGLAGFSSAEHPLLTGEGNLFTRLLGNILLISPTAVALWGLFFIAKKSFKKTGVKKLLSAVFGVLLLGTSVLYVLTMNMRSKPNTERLWDGHNDYLDGVDKTADKDSPNVLFILMDDLGRGDVSLNGAIYETPNIDSVGENGLNLTNFYSAYSVCSPARFAALTGRYPYRGYADNVIYPTVDTLSPFAQTRIFNSIEMATMPTVCSVMK